MKTTLAIAAAVALTLSLPAAHAAPKTYTATLTGAAESPPNASPGTGLASVVFDTAAHTLHVTASFADLLSPTFAAHIHCCIAPPGVAPVATMTPSFIGFPLGVTSGDFHNTFDSSLASTYRAGFITDHGGTPASAEAALAAGLDAGTAYFNIHTIEFGGGEIRGFLAPIPEPSTYALMALGLAAVGFAAKRRRA